MGSNWKISDESWVEFRRLLSELETVFAVAPGTFVGRDEAFRRAIDAFIPAFLAVNEEINLTAIREPEEVLWKHFFDSLLLLKLRPQGLLLDWGSGGGFPGIPVVFFRKFIEQQETPVILLDGRAKKMNAVKSVLAPLGDFAVDFLHARGEDFILENRVAAVVMRAVAAPKDILPWTSPKVSDWFFFASKGQQGEWMKIEPLLAKRGLKLRHVLEETLPKGYGERKILHFSA